MLQWTKDEAIVLPLAMLCMIIITVFLTLLLRKKSEKIKQLPLMIIAGIVVILEVIKQIRALIIGYDMWTFPLHYCSTFLFSFALAQFGTEKIKRIAKPVAFACALTVSLTFYLSPSSIIGSACSNVFASFNSFHTFFYHHLVILYAMLSITLLNYKPQKKDILSIFIVMACYYAFTVPFAFIVNVNYCNFLFSVIDILEKVRQVCGQVVFDIILFFGVVGGTTLFGYLYYLVFNWISKKRQKNISTDANPTNSNPKV